MDTKSPKAVIRDLWKDAIDGAETVDIEAEAQRITGELANDVEFCQAYARIFLADTVVDVGRALLHQNRTFIRSGAVFTTPTNIRDQVRQEAVSKFAKWMEFDPREKVQISLPQMTKEQVLASAMEREKQGTTDIKTAAWLRLIAGRLSKGQKVCEVWTDGELTDIQERLRVKITTGLDGIQSPTASAAD